MIKILIYVCIITSMIGSASVFAIDLGIIQLSMFRASILFLFLYIILKILIKNEKIRLNSKGDNIYSIRFMLIWVIYAFFSLAWVRDYNAWLKAMFYLNIGLIIFIIFPKYLKNKFDVLLAFRLIFIMALIHNCLGWYEINTGSYLFLETEKIAAYTRVSAPVTTFGNTNDFATFMLLSVWISYICLNNAKNLILKLIHMFSMISSVLLIISTNSRAILLGLLLSTMAFIVLSMRRKRTRNFLLMILGLVFFIILLNSDIIINIFTSISNNLSFNFSSQSGSVFVRINLIKNGLHFLISTFGFGVGAGNIEHWMSNEAIYYTEGIINMHNWWLEILVGYGLLIFVLYLLFYVKLFKSTYNKIKYSRNAVDMSISLGIMCFMAGYAIGSVSSSSNINSEWLWVFWGLAVAYQGISENKSDRTFA